MVTVEIDKADLRDCRTDAMRKLMVRKKLMDAGIPLRPWSESMPERGTLEWFDDPTRPGIRVVTWQEHPR